MKLRAIGGFWWMPQPLLTGVDLENLGNLVVMEEVMVEGRKAAAGTNLIFVIFL